MGQSRNIILRFLQKIRVSESRAWNASPCWEWSGAKNKDGYGQLRLDANVNPEGKIAPYRFAYEYFIGAIAEGFEPDHLCNNALCCSPFHLEAVTHEENCRRRAKRQETCKWGHPRKRIGKCKICNNLMQLAFRRGIKFKDMMLEQSEDYL